VSATECDIFALQDEISQAIVSALKLKLFPEEEQAIESRGTNNVDAYDILLRARAASNLQSGTEVRRSIDLEESVSRWCGSVSVIRGRRSFARPVGADDFELW